MNDDALPLGNFSVSLAVQDIAASRAFYEKLGFRAADASTQGPASFMVTDPDGNPILFDQHV